MGGRVGAMDGGRDFGEGGGGRYSGGGGANTPTNISHTYLSPRYVF